MMKKLVCASSWIFVVSLSVPVFPQDASTAPSDQAAAQINEYVAMRNAFVEVYRADFAGFAEWQDGPDVGIATCDAVRPHIIGFEPEGSFDYVILAEQYAGFLVQAEPFVRDRAGLVESLSMTEELLLAEIRLKKEELAADALNIYDLITPGFVALASELSRNNAKEGYEFSWSASCGGTPFGDFEIRMEPNNGTLALITQWAALKCKGEGIPIYSNACRGWQSVATPSLEMTGNYHYRASWKDKKSSNGQLSFENREIGDYIVTIERRGVRYAKKPEDRNWFQLFPNQCSSC